MTSDPVTLPAGAPVRQAAGLMRERDIGDVLVMDGDRLTGIVTDRDLVVRAMAHRDDLSDCHLRDVCSEHLITATVNEDVDTVISRMRHHAIRRVPVVDGGRPVGMFALGDAAIEKDLHSVLAPFSAAPGNA